MCDVFYCPCLTFTSGRVLSMWLLYLSLNFQRHHRSAKCLEAKFISLMILNLCLCFLKMLHAPREEIPILDKRRRYIVLTESSLYWDGLAGVAKLDFSRMPSRAAAQLLEDMRAGADGRAWLVCSSTGRVGVLKFTLKEVLLSFLHHPYFYTLSRDQVI